MCLKHQGPLHRHTFVGLQPVITLKHNPACEIRAGLQHREFLPWEEQDLQNAFHVLKSANERLNASHV